MSNTLCCLTLTQWIFPRFEKKKKKKKAVRDGKEDCPNQNMCIKKVAAILIRSLQMEPDETH